MNNNRIRRKAPRTPNKVYKPVVVVLRIFDAKTDEMENETIRTIDAAERREWILSTVMWAVMNGKAVEIINKEDDRE